MPVTQPANSQANISQTSNATPSQTADSRAAANRAAINRENSQLSTGPRTGEGKARVSLNALKTGLTGRTVLMPGDDAALYTAHLQRYLAEYKPSSDGEKDLVQALADTQWRLNRIPALEMNLFALGAIEFADKFDAYPEATRAGLIQAHTFMAWMRQFNNLSLQEVRLQRRYDKTIDALRAMQAARDERRGIELRQAAQMYLLAKKENRLFDPIALGFEFSTQNIETYIALSRSQTAGPGFIPRSQAA